MLLLPNLNPNNTTVMDNAPFRTVGVDKTLATLLFIDEIKPPEKYITDEFTTSYRHKVIRLPPSPLQLNRTDMGSNKKITLQKKLVFQ